MNDEKEPVAVMLNSDESSENDINKNSNNTEEENAALEKQHFHHVVNAFKSYKLHSWRRLYKSLKFMNSLPNHQRELLKSYKVHLDKVRKAINHNSTIIETISKDAFNVFEGNSETENFKLGSVTQFDIDKVQSVLKQIYREWSAEAKDERDASFKPIIDEIAFLFPPAEVSPGDIRILVPGAALGRLPYEIAKIGYTCEGCDFSFYMLLTSNFILNKSKGQNLYHIYPWVHQYHNNLKSSNQLLKVNFPDEDPNSLPPDSEFSMAAGNFTEVYTVPDSYDCVASCFFLDTANNIIDYIETIMKILRPGGYWINLGPLLYHHADLPDEDSIEPSYDEIREIIAKLGFEIVKEEVNLSTPYCHNPLSMLRYDYKSVFFVCQKPESSIDIYSEEEDEVHD